MDFAVVGIIGLRYLVIVIDVRSVIDASAAWSHDRRGMSLSLIKRCEWVSCWEVPDSRNLMLGESEASLEA